MWPQKIKPSKEFTKFCNNLRCPLCDSQLDGNIHDKRADLFCASDNAEYKAVWKPDQEFPEYELLKYCYTQYEYEINISKTGLNTFETYINRFSMDYHISRRRSSCQRVFDYSGDRIPFFRKRMDEDKFLNKLKTYSLFS